MEVTAVGTGEGFVDALYQRELGGFRDVELSLVIEGPLIKVPIYGGRAGEGNGGSIHGGEGVNNKLVRGCGFGDL